MGNQLIQFNPKKLFAHVQYMYFFTGREHMNKPVQVLIFIASLMKYFHNWNILNKAVLNHYFD